MPSRRQFLAALVFGPAAARLAAARGAQILVEHRAATGNRALVPPAQAGGHILCAGDRELRLIEPATGSPGWNVTHDLPGGASFRPRIADGIAVCAGRGGIGAWLIDSGRRLWRHEAHRQIGPPAVADGLAFFGDGHELVAVDLAGGEVRWRFAAVADTLIAYAPAVRGDTVLVGPGDGRLYALSAADGSLRWRVDGTREWQYLRQLHVAGNRLIAGGYTEKLYGIDIATGRILWEFNAGNFINSHHVAGDLACLWSPTGWLYAIDTASGTVRWRHRTTGYRGDAGDWAPLLAELASLEGRLYALDLAGVLHVLSLAEGREIGRWRAPEPVAPFVLPLSGGRVCLGSADGHLLFARLA